MKELIEAKIVEITKNASGGDISVKSSDENVARVRLEGNKIIITPQIIGEDGKKVTITVTSAGTNNYKEQTVTYEATVNRGEITIVATPYTGEYDGSSHPAVSNVEVEPKDATITYSLNGGEYSKNIPEVTNADTYTISIKASKPGYVTKEITKTITVNKQGNGNNEGGRNANLQLSAYSGTLTYPTNETFTITKNASGGKLSVSSSNTNVVKATISGTTVTLEPQIIGTDGQKATITVKSTATSNYEEQTATYEATVNRGEITISATPYTGTYDGSNHPAVSEVTTTPTNCTITYSLNGGAESTTIPEITNADTYTISIKASKPGYVTKEITKTITIKKQGNENNEGTNVNLQLSAYSGTLTYPTNRTFTITKNTSGGNLSVSSSNTNAVTATISGTTVTLEPQIIETDGQKATITVKSAATSNFEEQTATYEATVNRGRITLTATEYSETKDGNAHPVVSNVRVDPTDATVTYSLNGGAYTGTVPTITEIGTYTIKIKAEKTGYKPEEIEKTARIIENTIELSATAYTGTYDGNSHPAVSNVKVTPTDATVTYSLDGGTYSSSIPTVTNANTYTVTIRAVKTGYITKEITKTITISKKGNTGGTSNANLQLSAYSGTLTYPNTGTFTITKNTSGGTLSVRSSNTNVVTASLSGTKVTLTPKAITTASKTATITVTSAATSNYQAQTATYSVTVYQGTITITATEYSGTYNGSSHNAVSNVSTNPSGCTITYSLNSGSYSTSIPKVTNAGSYTISIKATKSGYATKTISKTASISKAAQNISVSTTSLRLASGGTSNVTVTGAKGTVSVQYPTGNSYTTTCYSSYVKVTAKSVTNETSGWFNIYAAATDNYLESSKIKITVIAESNLKANTLTLSTSSKTLTYPTSGTITVSKNTSGGTLSVSSSNTSVVSATISGTTITLTPKAITSESKTATITVTSAQTSTYKSATATCSVTVKQGTITITATSYNGTYDGSSHPAVSNVSTDPTGCTVTYSKDGGSYSSTIPKVTSLGTYTISIKAVKTGYTTKTISKTVTVSKKTNTLTLSATSKILTYPTTGTITVSTNTSGGALSVKSSNTSVVLASISGTTITLTPKAVTSDGQTATITVTSAATGNYESATATCTVTVNRGTMSGTIQKYAEWKYDRSSS